MAQAVVSMKLNSSLTSVGPDETREIQILNGNVTLTPGGTYATGGLPLIWVGKGGINGATGASFYAQSNQTAPFQAYFESVAGSGYTYGWNQATSKLQLFVCGGAGAPMQELANGTVVPVDTILFQAFFKKG